MTSDNRELALANQLADAAGEIARRYFRAPLSIEQKADSSPVTQADRECEAAMRALIEGAFPSHGIIGEEYGNVRGESPYQWVLDPIDGTRAFIAGETTFTTLIALAKNTVPILGIIDQPVTRERWIGLARKPTTCNGQTILVRPAATLSQTSISTTSTNYFTPEETKIFERLKKKCASVSLGGDAYAYGMLASGKRDIVIDANMKTYDFCALVPVVEGAGGIITDWEGAPLTISSSGRVLAAASKELHAEALKIIQQL